MEKPQQLPSGRRRQHYTGSDGQRRSTTDTSPRKVSDKAALELAWLIEAHATQEAKGATLTRFDLSAEEWLQTRRPDQPGGYMPVVYRKRLRPRRSPRRTRRAASCALVPHQQHHQPRHLDRRHQQLLYQPPGGAGLTLAPGQVYHVYISARNAAGWGPEAGIALETLAGGRAWDGSAFRNCKVRAWDGSQWRVHRVRSWDGSAWRNVR